MKCRWFTWFQLAFCCNLFIYGAKSLFPPSHLVDLNQLDDGFGESHNSDLPQSKQIPLLEEVFRKFPRFPINLDIKTNNDKLIEQVDRLIRAYSREDVTVWGSFDEAVNQKIYKLNSDVSLMFSLKGVVRLLLLLVTGLLPFVPFRETYFEIIMPNAILKWVVWTIFDWRI